MTARDALMLLFAVALLMNALVTACLNERLDRLESSDAGEGISRTYD